MCRVITENTPVIARKQVKIDEGKIESNYSAVLVLPHFFTNHPIACGASNCSNLIGDFDGLASLLSCCSHAKSITQVRVNTSHLWANRLDRPQTQQTPIQPDERSPCTCINH